MRTIKLTLAYDGTNYAGWQVQPDKMTVQGTLEAAIEKVTGHATRVLASGRTDAGVHAAGQVVGFTTASELAPDVLRRALNAVLPDDVAVLDVAEVAAGFHAIRDAVRKRYAYTIHDGPIRDVFYRTYHWHYPQRLDAAAMHRASQALLGTHDFSSFETVGAPRESSVRTITHVSVRRLGDCPGFRPWGLSRFSANQHNHSITCRPKSGTVPFTQSLAREAQVRGPGLDPASPSVTFDQGATADSSSSARVPLALPVPAQSSHSSGCLGHSEALPQSDYLHLEVEADGFLYNMVRAIVGTLVEVGRGVKPESWPDEVLAATDRRRAGPTAPPEGLCLLHVDY